MPVVKEKGMSNRTRMERSAPNNQDVVAACGFAYLEAPCFGRLQICLPRSSMVCLFVCLLGSFSKVDSERIKYFDIEMICP